MRSVVDKARSLARGAIEKSLHCRVLRVPPDSRILTLPSGDLYVALNRHPALLPVMADNNLHWPLELTYVFNGCGTGVLSLALMVEGGPDLVRISRREAMPCEWRLRVDTEVALNGECVAHLLSGIERKNGWLISELEFISDSGPALRRKLRHRILNGSPECDAAYFNGENYRDYEQEFATSSHEIVNRILRHGKIQSILDIGCATGVLLSQAQARGLRVAGVDSSGWAIAQARKRLSGDVCKVLDVDHASAADFDGTYDAVVMNNVLEHSKDPDRLLRLAASLISPGGLLYCATLNADSWFHKTLGASWVGYSDYSHHSPWLTARWLRDRIRESGLTLVEFKLPNFVWTENTCDPAIQELAMVLEFSAAGQLFVDGWGDLVEVLARRV